MSLAMAIDNALQPDALAIVPRSLWPVDVPPPLGLLEVWRSREFLVQVFAAPDGAERLSVCRSTFDLHAGRWKDGISWDDLQRLKRECGRGRREAVEIYPRDCDVVNVANMRHLWVLKDGMPFTWKAMAVKGRVD